MTKSILDPYLGREAGRRVYAGDIRRGDGKTIRSVLFMSDLRGFTSLQTSPRGWNAIVRPGIPQANVERTNDVNVTISINQFASYEIFEPEVIEVVVRLERLPGRPP